MRNLERWSSITFCPWCGLEKEGDSIDPEFPRWHENCLKEFRETLILMAKNYKIFGRL